MNVFVKIDYFIIIVMRDTFTGKQKLFAISKYIIAY